MPTKEEVLSQLTSSLREGVVTPEDVVAVLPNHSLPTSTTQESRLAEVLYYIGGGIVCLGIAVLIAQNWDVLPRAARVMSTLGSALAAYLVAVLLQSKPTFNKVSRAFFLIAAIILPIGLNVTLRVADVDIANSGTQTMVIGICLAAFGLSFFLFRQTLLLVFTTLFGTAFFYALTSHLVGTAPIFEEPEFSEYRTLAAGLTWMLLGYSFMQTRYKQFSGTLYAFGSLAFLGSALALSGYKPEQNTWWELLFPLLVFGIIFLSVHIRSKSFLVFGSLFLMAYILKLTAEYFSDSLGWPLALVVAGLALIGVGYVMVYINRRYFRSKA